MKREIAIWSFLVGAALLFGFAAHNAGVLILGFLGALLVLGLIEIPVWPSRRRRGV